MAAAQQALAVQQALAAAQQMQALAAPQMQALAAPKRRIPPQLIKRLFNAPAFLYNKENLLVHSIEAFTLAGKALNDKNNKTRENIIGAIINQKVPKLYYCFGSWRLMKEAVFTYIHWLYEQPYITVKCIHKAGRGKTHDFHFVFTKPDGIQETLMIELKFNAATISDAPQFVSPMKPSQYLSASYEEYYYATYLPLLAAEAGLPLPSLADYLKQIHATRPECMKAYQDLYYQGCAGSSKYTGQPTAVNFYELAKQLSNESISTFIEKTDLQAELLSAYLRESQKEKRYMLYKTNAFHLQHHCVEDYTIESVTKNPKKFRYECSTKSGKKMSILLRWKNGNGIAFPAFQIS
jgi:hypothetical protein